MSERTDTLANDYEELQALSVFHVPEKIRILETDGRRPPEFYRLQISNCIGVESVGADGKPKYRQDHILIIRNFPANYPDRGALPDVIMQTPIFHPNVFDAPSNKGQFCFAKGSMTQNQLLKPLIERIIGMIQYQNQEYGNPANRDAERWAIQNKHLFPLRPNSGGDNQSQINLIFR
ncbi:hypothetical protein [Microseira wollei]|uniref:UBC core domain-containing protein n=1 Tax=Microseira wollei NIES-4236 TaxID=2530354 RepID=A0AAV3XGG5_9CYAN|nr:hypothetical protein [Microseira wollei]GET41494.1 hypothetical protein MiSe_63060 [Microseira wollei NIES-4236]